MEILFRPLDVWPGVETLNRRESTFKASYSKTLDLLDKELYQLNARNVVISAFFSSEQIRLDGIPRGDARPRKPGIIVHFESTHGAMMFPCDCFTDWQSNLRAIALSLEALRKVDRYGVTKRAEQYRGWAQIPEHTEDPITIIANFSGMSRETLHHTTELAKAIREALRRSHPDTGGSHEAFLKVNQAREQLEARP